MGNRVNLSKCRLSPHIGASRLLRRFLCFNTIVYILSHSIIRITIKRGNNLKRRFLILAISIILFYFVPVVKVLDELKK